MKSKILIEQHDGTKKMAEGDMIMSIQASRVIVPSGDPTLEVNMLWSFDPQTTPSEMKSMLGSFLSGIGDIWGEKMVTEMIMHYARENGRIEKVDGQDIARLKSKGIDFKKL